MQKEEDLKKVAESIDNGSYFDDALEWYIQKFCRPISERVFWFAAVLFFMFFMYSLQSQITSWYPLKINRPIIIYNKNVQMKQVVDKMDNPYHNADYAILRYLIKNYIQMREEFLKGSLTLIKVDNRLKRVANNSTKEVSRDYQRIFDLDGVKNPIKRLGRPGSRRIRFREIILDIKKLSLFDKVKRFNKLIELPRAATVIYEATEETLRHKKRSIWKIKLKFNYSGVILDTENKNLTLTEFTVTDYQQERIQ